jgi:hypothetical protein
MSPTVKIFLLIILAAAACKKPRTVNPRCNDDFNSSFSARNFSMGFTTWPFGADYADREATYSFISSHADVYSEQFDNYIPWKALINNEPLPLALTNDIASRLSLKPRDHRLLLSVSLLNIPRDGLLADVDGFIPAYTSMDDPEVASAYMKYLKYLLQAFHPDYLVLAMEVNELRIKRPDLWPGYLSLIETVKRNLKIDYPTLKMAESVTLHNWYNPNVTNQSAFIAEINNYVSQHDFAAVSFYPFLKGQHTAAEFQQAFDFLHAQVTKPVAFVETGHIAEDLNVPAFQLSVKTSDCEQKEYLESLLKNAKAKDYEFIIWWTHRDYDELWQIFPAETKDIGALWKDTGLVTGEGESRPALTSWNLALSK